MSESYAPQSEVEPKGGWIVYTDENGEQVRIPLEQYRAEGRG